MVVCLSKPNMHMKLWVPCNLCEMFWFFMILSGPSTCVTLSVNGGSALWTLHWTHSFSIYWLLCPSFCSYVDWSNRNEKGVIVSEVFFSLFFPTVWLFIYLLVKPQITTFVRIVKFGTNNLLEEWKFTIRVKRMWASKYKLDQQFRKNVQNASRRYM